MLPIDIPPQHLDRGMVRLRWGPQEPGLRCVVVFHGDNRNLGVWSEGRTGEVGGQEESPRIVLKA